MKIFSAFLFLSLLTSFMQQKKKRVIFFGDSITQQGAQPGGYITRIDSLCKADGRSADYEFAGAGISGNKVYDLYLRMDSDVLAKRPDWVVIYIGVNDVWHKVSAGTGTDADKFERFYQAILNKLDAAGIRVVVCTPAVIGEKTDFSNPQDGDLNEYSKIIRQLAIKNSLPLVDLRGVFLGYNNKHNPDNKDHGILTTDRVHLNATGNEVVAEAMWKILKSLN